MNKFKEVSFVSQKGRIRDRRRTEFRETRHIECAEATDSGVLRSRLRRCVSSPQSCLTFLHLRFARQSQILTTVSARFARQSQILTTVSARFARRSEIPITVSARFARRPEILTTVSACILVKVPSACGFQAFLLLSVAARHIGVGAPWPRGRALNRFRFIL